MNEPMKETLHYDPKTKCGSGGCLGELFPNFQRLVPNVINRGRVFGVLLQSHGIGFQRKELIRDEAAWNKCLECSDFDRCLQVSMANLLLQQAVASY